MVSQQMHLQATDYGDEEARHAILQYFKDTSLQVPEDVLSACVNLMTSYDNNCVDVRGFIEQREEVLLLSTQLTITINASCIH
jgi:hypothetical protein